MNTDSHEPSWGTTMALDFSSVGDRADSNMQVNEIMFKVQICHVMIFDCKKFNSPHYIAINLPIVQKSIKKQYINASIEPLICHKLQKETQTTTIYRKN